LINKNIGSKVLSQGVGIQTEPDVDRKVAKPQS